MKIQAIIAIIALTLVASIVYAQAQTKNLTADGSVQPNQSGGEINRPNSSTTSSTPASDLTSGSTSGATSGVTGATSGMGTAGGNGLPQENSAGIAPQTNDPAGSVNGYGSKIGQDALPDNATGSTEPASNGSNAYMR